MKRTEALEALHQAQLVLSAAQDAVTYANLDLEDAECDHPDTTGHVCDHCGIYDDNPESRNDEDFSRVLNADCHGLTSEMGHVSHWGYPNGVYGYPVPANA